MRLTMPDAVLTGVLAVSVQLILLKGSQSQCHQYIQTINWFSLGNCTLCRCETWSANFTDCPSTFGHLKGDGKCQEVVNM